ncbi:cobyrinate a,c-diamide synthase [Desulfospira joergensenii]|uniref:cobyrinate a,c-diamide synthase n=1 Tax=Desulfospira joergensenii TaxID=53329 RepID=UPI0003B63A1D|nr:cobyrinate a,c-diamide synthase [Desulfospira joergensenii]
MQASRENVPGVIVAGLRGGSGKTIISLGITAAWKESNLRVSPFKKGPDYIDAGWLSRAAGRPCYNLDTFLCTPETVISSYFINSQDSDLALIEGNRGLYDGIDTEGSTSTSELAKLLNLPVLLVLDCTKSTRTMAALLMGCMNFDPGIRICGVVLNRVAGKRHEGKVRANIERFCNIPVLGAVPKLSQGDFPERHMGLVTSEEHSYTDQAIESAIKIARENIDLDRLYELVTASDGQTRPGLCPPARDTGKKGGPDSVTIGIIRDSAFQFYYPDNLRALEDLGARIVFISPLKQETIPPVHAIYMGGGFPETHAPQLAKNHSFRENLKRLSLEGLPIYAECGGLIFLGESIRLDDVEYPMSGIFPIKFGLSKKPQGHGYTKVEVVHSNPFYKKGETLRGHEFRYSKIRSIEYKDTQMAFRMERGKGILDKKDGFHRNNTFGTYTHIHALGTPSWAPSLVAKAMDYKLHQPR